MPHGAQQRPRALPPLGIRRPAALQLAAPLPHESRRHRADGVLRQQLVLRQFVLLCPADPGPSDQGGRHRDGPPRRGPVRAAPDRRSGPGPPRGGGRGAGDPRLGQEGRADHPRQPGRRRLAAVPAPLPAEREVLPGLGPAHAQFALGHLPGRRVRQRASVERGARLCPVRAGAGPEAAHAAGHPRPRRSQRATTPWST